MLRAETMLDPPERLGSRRFERYVAPQDPEFAGNLDQTKA
jgi:hypothetical protein